VSTIVYTEQGEEGGEEEDKDSRANGRRVSTEEFLEMEEDVWKDGAIEDTSAKTLGSHYRAQESICTKERNSVFTF